MSPLASAMPYHAPDGFASRQLGGAELKTAVAASSGGRFAQPMAQQTAGTEQDDLYFHNQEGHDEGLVHSHGWARSR